MYGGLRTGRFKILNKFSASLEPGLCSYCKMMSQVLFFAHISKIYRAWGGHLKQPVCGQWVGHNGQHCSKAQFYKFVMLLGFTEPHYTSNAQHHLSTFS